MRVAEGVGLFRERLPVRAPDILLEPRCILVSIVQFPVDFSRARSLENLLHILVPHEREHRRALVSGREAPRPRGPQRVTRRMHLRQEEEGQEAGVPRPPVVIFREGGGQHGSERRIRHVPGRAGRRVRDGEEGVAVFQGPGGFQADAQVRVDAGPHLDVPQRGGGGLDGGVQVVHGGCEPVGGRAAGAHFRLDDGREELGTTPGGGGAPRRCKSDGSATRGGRGPPQRECGRRGRD
mmetsp:Transcript_12889/g.25807  ORF Transcript_12889/g.25807 Transcript_12889/m.25807 type:complete len:237 (-) Transcript_12889:71-781(-)